jgi:hypothetical protein
LLFNAILMMSPSKASKGRVPYWDVRHGAARAKGATRV